MNRIFFVDTCLNLITNHREEWLREEWYKKKTSPSYTQGRLLAKWNTGRYDLHQKVLVQGLFVIKVKGATNSVFEYVKAQ